MDPEKEIIAAFVFKRSGKKEMSLSEFYLTLSIELNWFTPEDAKILTHQMINAYLLSKENENITPRFDISTIKIPSGFYPSKDVLKKDFLKSKEKNKDLLTIIIERIVEKTDEKQLVVFEKIKNISEEKNITIAIAALLVGQEHNIVFKDVLKEVEKTTFEN
jgi:hypothetical protein